DLLVIEILDIGTTDEFENGIANENKVAVFQYSGRDFLSIHKSAVGTLEVLNFYFAFLKEHFGVLSGDIFLIDCNVRLVAATNDDFFFDQIKFLAEVAAVDHQERW